MEHVGLDELMYADGIGEDSHSYLRLRHKAETKNSLMTEQDQGKEGPERKPEDPFRTKNQKERMPPMKDGNDPNHYARRHLLAEARDIMRANERHDLGNKGEGVVVAVLDSGIDADHPDLKDSIVHEACFIDCLSGNTTGPGSANDVKGHGTHVASIITANNIVVDYGIAPKASIVAIKVLGNDGVCKEEKDCPRFAVNYSHMILSNNSAVRYMECNLKWSRVFDNRVSGQGAATGHCKSFVVRTQLSHDRIELRHGDYYEHSHE